MCKIESQKSRTPCFLDIQVNKIGLWISHVITGLHLKAILSFILKCPWSLDPLFMSGDFYNIPVIVSFCGSSGATIDCGWGTKYTQDSTFNLCGNSRAVPTWLPARTVQYILICRRTSSPRKVLLLCMWECVCVCVCNRERDRGCEASCSGSGWQSLQLCVYLGTQTVICRA